MGITRHTMNVVATTSGGASQVYFSPSILSGLIHAIDYKRGTSGTTASGVASGAKVVFTGAETGIPILTIATASGDNHMYFYPRAYAQDASGAQLGLTSAATPPGFPQFIPIANERLRMEITSGGNCSNGGLRCTVNVYIDGRVG